MRKEIYFAGGCFWGVEKYFASIRGVVETDVGYANGGTENPSYEEVCHNHTGHAEAVRVVYDDDVVTLPLLLKLYFDIIDPVSVNRQGNDRGIQYRTGIYYIGEDDLLPIKQAAEQIQNDIGQPLAVEIKPLDNYYRAEQYHQAYLDKNPGGYCHISSSAFRKAQQANQPDFKPLTEDEKRSTLTEMQYHVTQENGTEPPYQNEYYNLFEEGIYVDITSGQPLFVSTDKFESGCGWPSFSKPIASGLVVEKSDTSHHMVRTEVRSKGADAHLGHVFNDGPAEKGGLRYCINSASLRFIPKAEMASRGYGQYLSLFS